VSIGDNIPTFRWIVVPPSSWSISPRDITYFACSSVFGFHSVTIVCLFSGKYHASAQCPGGFPGTSLKVRQKFDVLKISYVQRALPLQAWSGPEGSRMLRFPYFMTTAQDGGKVVNPTHRPLLTPGNTPGTHFCWGAR
jgi:hypothetical protein